MKSLLPLQAQVDTNQKERSNEGTAEVYEAMKKLRMTTHENTG
jgi:hypothetical protein